MTDRIIERRDKGLGALIVTVQLGRAQYLATIDLAQQPRVVLYLHRMTWLPGLMDSTRREQERFISVSANNPRRARLDARILALVPMDEPVGNTAPPDVNFSDFNPEE